MANAETREQTACVIFGSSCKLPDRMLPTYSDVIKYYNLIKHQLKSSRKNKQPLFSEIAELVTLKIEEIWKTASITSLVSHTRVLQILRTYHDQYRTILKPYHDRKDTPTYTARINTFTEQSNKLFDICTCKCEDACSCPKDRKVPELEKEFLHDQRTERKMMIGGVDRSETKRLKKKAIRSQKTKKQLFSNDGAETSCNQSFVCSDIIHENSGEQSDDAVDEVDTSYENIRIDSARKRKQNPSTVTQMRVKLPAVAQICDRHGISDRSAAALSSAVLQDIGIVTEDDKTKVIDRSKVRRERSKKREELQDRADDCIPGLYFDGRKDKTLTRIKKLDGKYHRARVEEEHVCIINEPGSSYFGHVSVEKGSGKGIAKGITDYLLTRNVDFHNILAVGCDGTNVNTGRNGGVIRMLEEYIDRPLQWLVCQLHANELPLRHLFEKIDGSTTGPRGYSGPIGKALPTCNDLPLTSFVAIKCELPQVDRKDLSTDQLYMYDMSTAVSTGSCPVDLLCKNPGLMCHSRWLTMANRILRLYVSTENPTDDLIAIVTFIQKVYSPMWFEIKTSPSCKDGARHLCSTIVKSRYLSEEHKIIVDPVIQRNGFFGHPENILLSMLTDENPVMRQLGLRRILKARNQSQKSVRRFVVPKLNFAATGYIDLVDWNSVTVTEPPVMSKMSTEELEEAIVERNNTGIVEFGRFPCHTQAVERGVKLVTEASAAVCGYVNRDGFIRSRLESRDKMAVFDTKSQYKQ